jgi:hypothetical protein
MKKSSYLIMFFCFGLFYSGSAQNSVNIIKIIPQTLINNTLKFSWEHATSAKTSLNVSPSISLYDRKNEKVFGAGIDVARKIYVSKMDSAAPLKGFYGAASVCYAFYTTEYTKYDDSTGVVYSYSNAAFTEHKYNEKIHQVGADLYLGYQFPIKDVLYIDIFLGGGLRYSFSSEEKNSYYKSGINDYAFTGIIPKAGIKIGLKI